MSGIRGMADPTTCTVHITTRTTMWTSTPHGAKPVAPTDHTAVHLFGVFAEPLLSTVIAELAARTDVIAIVLGPAPDVGQ